MKHSENIHRLFDGELSEEESKILQEAMAVEPSLAKEFDSIKSLADLHRDSIPLPKDELFIEREFQGIQNLILEESEGTAPGNSSRKASKVVAFPGSNWLRTTMAVAAAVALTVTGAWFFNQQNTGNSNMNDPNVAFVETDIDGASSMIFMDEQSGWTFVWVDEPTISTEVAG